MLRPLAVAVLVLVSIAAGIYRVDAAARKENVKYLRCAVCEEISKQLFDKVTEKKSTQKKKLTEFEIIELAENLCNVKKQESEWMFFLDIVREGDKLKLVEQPEEGECNTKCKTIERACQEVIGDHDTDIAEFIHTHIADLSQEGIFNALCKSMSKSCLSKPPPLPKELDLGEPFVAKPTKDADMARLMRTMSDMPGGEGMRMYSKDSLMNMNGLGNDDDEEDDDDDDTDETRNLQSLLKKQALEEKPKRSIVAEAVHQMREVTREAVFHARNTKNKVTRYLKRWWKRAKSTKHTQRAEL